MPAGILLAVGLLVSAATGRPPAAEPPVAAQTTVDQDIRNKLDALAARVTAQQAQIDAQRDQIAADQREIAALKAQSQQMPTLDAARGMGLAAVGPQQTTVGDSLAPPKPDIAERAQAMPQGQGVLTPAGRTTFQPPSPISGPRIIASSSPGSSWCPACRSVRSRRRRRNANGHRRGHRVARLQQPARGRADDSPHYSAPTASIWRRCATAR